MLRSWTTLLRSASPATRPFRSGKASASATIEAMEPRRLLSVSVLAWRDDPAGDGQNLGETTLTPTNVASAAFGQKAAVALDGQAYAQPLIDTGVDITVGSQKGVHNVVYVATENDSVYAMDALTGAVLWKDSFLSPGVTTIPAADTHSTNLTPQIGITSTPVIDPATGCIYVVASTKQTIAGNIHYVMKLHALSLGSGAEQLKGPVTIADTICNNPTGNRTFTYVSGPEVAGTGAGSVSSQVFYNVLLNNQRSALTLANGVIYIANSSHSDTGAYHGWILGYKASNLALTAVFNDTPNGSQGGIWMGGGGITVDAQGYLYATMGNGTFDTTLTNGFPSKHDYGESVIKLAIDPASSPTHQNGNGWGLKVVDYFTPHDQAALNSKDLDVSTTALLLPTSVGDAAHRNLLLAGGKGGEFYLIDTSNMGKYNATTDHVVQEIDLGDSLTTPAYFNGRLYVTSNGGASKVYPISNAHIGAAISGTSTNFGYPGANPTVSANGTSDGIVWEINTIGDLLEGYNAANYDKPIFQFKLDSTVKFTPVTIANGLVYAATADKLYIFGLTSGTMTKTG